MLRPSGFRQLYSDKPKRSCARCIPRPRARDLTTRTRACRFVYVINTSSIAVSVDFKYSAHFNACKLSLGLKSLKRAVDFTEYLFLCSQLQVFNTQSQHPVLRKPITTRTACHVTRATDESRSAFMSRDTRYI